MNKHTEEQAPKQRELFAIAPFIARDERAAKVDKRPAPIQTAEEFKFPLQHYAPMDSTQEYQYAIQDWIAGLTETDNRKAGRLWSDMQNQMSVSIVPLDYVAADGKTYQRDFTNAKGLYLIAQNLRATKTRPQLKKVREFLATSAAWVELIARDERAAKVAIQQIEEHHGLREESKIQRKSFTQIAREKHIRYSPKYGALTGMIYHKIAKTVSPYTAKKEIVAALGLDDKQAKNFRDNINDLMLGAIKLAEQAAGMKMENWQGRLTDDEQLEIVKQCARVVATSAHQLADIVGVDLVTGQPLIGKGRG